MPRGKPVGEKRPTGDAITVTGVGEFDPGSPKRIAVARALYPTCPFCRKEDPYNTIYNVLAMKEFTISGLCQSCQESVFGKN